MRILLLTILLVGAPLMAIETEPEPVVSNYSAEPESGQF